MKVFIYNVDLSLTTLPWHVYLIDEMQAELFISEQLLGDITALVRENLPMVY